MALFKFTRAILSGEPIEVYGGGLMQRDFTYVGDLVEAVMRLLPLPPSTAGTPYRTINIGGGQPVGLLDFIALLEDVIGHKAIRHDLPMQPGDVPRTYASPALLKRLTGYVPDTPLRQGIESFVSWYRNYYEI
jgi:UDP-glucuronate 4-epimerase